MAWPGKIRDKQSSSNLQFSEYIVASNPGCKSSKTKTQSFYTVTTCFYSWLTMNGPKGYKIAAIHGLAILHSWKSGQSMHCTGPQVPSLLVPYNAFMNAFDRFYQQRSCPPTMWLYKCIAMSLLPFSLDTTLQNAFSIAQKKEPTDIGLKEFKRKAPVQLVRPELLSRQNSFQRSFLQRFAEHCLFDSVLSRDVKCTQCKL